jgi:superfamily II DNA/RNA helicase
MEKFRELKLDEKILKSLKELKITEPSEIQAKAIPFVLEGRDVLGSSATGSGKTLAFGSGLIEKVKEGKGIQALVLTPTRELAKQITSNLRKFSKYYDLSITEIYGGVRFDPQVRALKKAEVVVGTPGRILDHIQRKTIDLSKVNFLVLDEADRMLEMGFIEDVTKIIKNCPKERQTLLFSATIPMDIEDLSKDYMKNPEFVSAVSQVDPTKLNQIFYDVQPNLKFSLLVHLLKKEKSGLVMVFCNTRRNVDIVTKALKDNDIDVLALHGGLTQNKRGNIMKAFHSNKAHVLVCTDVAARGLDIKDVSHVYNYDSPKTTIEYIHRIGRTARAGEEGKAISIVAQRDYENFRNVCDDESLTIKKESVPLLKVLDVDFGQRRSRDNRGGRSFGRSDSRGSHQRRDRGGRDSGNHERKPSYGRRSQSYEKKHGSEDDSRRDHRRKPQGRDNRQSNPRESRGRRPTSGRKPAKRNHGRFNSRENHGRSDSRRSHEKSQSRDSGGRFQSQRSRPNLRRPAGRGPIRRNVPITRR